MASIHEVARMAGVSTATVSKYINKKGYISTEKREAIEGAIQALNYVPNRSARQLKTRSASEVLCIVPNMNEHIYREIFDSLNTSLSPEYRIILQLTSDSPQREEQLLRECLNNPCAGVFLCTCAPDNTPLFNKVIQQTPLFFLLRQPGHAYKYNYIGFDHANIIHALTCELLDLGFSDIGLYIDDTSFSCEAECESAFRAAYAHKRLPIRENRIFSLPYTREAVFRSIMKLFDSGDFPSVFISSSFMCAQSISEVAHCRDMELGRDLFLFALGEDSWYNSMFVDKIICTYRDARKLGSVAASLWRKCIEQPSVFETVNIKMQDSFDFRLVPEYIHRLRANAAPRRAIPVTKKLRLAFNSQDTGSDAMKSLIPQFVKQYETDIEICLLDYDDLYQELKEDAASPGCRYDLFTVDAPWIPYLYQLGLFRDLTDYFAGAEIGRQFAPHVIERFGSHNGRIIGLPYVYSLSLLFYRKDLFADPELKQQFYDMYRVPLEPPRTWHMFNLIASFFTRAQNPLSPTEYGTSIFGGGYATPMCSELYPRIWSYGGSVFDKYGFVRLYSYENYKACLSLAETVRYSPLDTMTSSMYTGLQQLLDGKTAMRVNFSSNASQMTDSSRNLMRDRIGFVPLPDRKPVLAGWSIGVNRKTGMPERALDFLKWFSSLETASAYMTLGGISPIETLLDHELFLQIYPWTKLVKEEFSSSISRSIPPLPGIPVLEEEHVENILASIMFDYCAGKGPLEALLYRAHCELCAYAEKHDYPRNVIPQRMVFES